MAATLAGCGGSQSPIAGTEPMPRSIKVATRADDGRSWMNADAARHDLLYATDGVSNVYVYTYPQGRHVGTLTGFIDPRGECVDAAGDVYVVSSNGGKGSAQSAIVKEYAHGSKKPMETLMANHSGSGCAVDPGTGDVAVVGSWDYYGEYLGALSTYTKSGEGIITTYTRSFNAFSFCSYDDQGNLYLSSVRGSNDEVLARLPADTNEGLEPINVSVALYSYNAPVSVQWDGTHVTASSTPYRSPVKLYRLSILGSSATVVGTTTLGSRSNVRKTSQVWIQGKSVVDADYFKRLVGIDQWAYPRAARPRHVVPNSVHGSLYGLTISLASHG